MRVQTRSVSDVAQTFSSDVGPTIDPSALGDAESAALGTKLAAPGVATKRGTRAFGVARDGASARAQRALTGRAAHFGAFAIGIVASRATRFALAKAASCGAAGLRRAA